MVLSLPVPHLKQARTHILHQLHHHKPGSFAAHFSPTAAVAAEGAANIGLLGLQDIAASAPVQNVLEGPELFNLMANLFKSAPSTPTRSARSGRGTAGKDNVDVVTTGFKWLRAVAPGEFTGVHTDQVFLGRGSPRLLTAWLPLGDCPVQEGTVMVIPRSHKSSEFADIRRSYGASEVGSDGTISGWLTNDGSQVGKLVSPNTTGEGSTPVQWHTSDLKAGDLVVLSLDALHMSAANRSNKIRISCDTRWLPAADHRDPRLRVWRSRQASQDYLH